MIEETARVVATRPDHVWVETRRQSSCGACRLNKGCGTATVARVLGRRRTRLRVTLRDPFRPQDLAPGELVLIGLEESALLRGSVAVYLAPLLGLFLGAGLADLGLSAAGEEPAVLGGLLGLAAGLGWLRLYTRRIRLDPRFQPVLLRRLSPSSPVEAVSRL